MKRIILNILPIKPNYSLINIKLFVLIFILGIPFLGHSQVPCTPQSPANCNCPGGSQPAVGTNPLIDFCENIKVAFIIDESFSIGQTPAYVDSVRLGVLEFISTIDCPGAELAVVEFSINAALVSGYNPVNNTFKTNMEGYFNGVPFNGQTYMPQNVGVTGGTNWEAALRLVDQVLDTADLVIFFTDGNPTNNEWRNLGYNRWSSQCRRKCIV